MNDIKKISKEINCLNPKCITKTENYLKNYMFCINDDEFECSFCKKTNKMFQKKEG